MLVIAHIIEYIFTYIITYIFTHIYATIFACLFRLIFRCIFIRKSTYIIIITYACKIAGNCGGEGLECRGIYACMSTHIFFVTIPVLIISFDTISERY